MSTEKRTDEEIEHHLRSVMDRDFLGFRAEVLVPYMGYDAALPYLRTDEDGAPVVSREEWEAREILPPAAAGADYLPFAIGKIEDERGISASRSVEKFSEWAWLDGEDGLAQQLDSPDNYGHYGDKAVQLYADHYGITGPLTGEVPPAPLSTEEA